MSFAVKKAWRQTVTVGYGCCLWLLSVGSTHSRVRMSLSPWGIRPGWGSRMWDICVCVCVFVCFVLHCQGSSHPFTCVWSESRPLRVGGGCGGDICISDLRHASAEWNWYNYYTPWLPLELYPFWLAFFFFFYFISIQLINSFHGDRCRGSIKFSQRASHSYSNEIHVQSWMAGKSGEENSGRREAELGKSCFISKFCPL